MRLIGREPRDDIGLDRVRMHILEHRNGDADFFETCKNGGEKRQSGDARVGDQQRALDAKVARAARNFGDPAGACQDFRWDAPVAC
jgi:hypothetical protein